jgi:5-methylcytosine-specific restriction enzyme A
MPHVYEMQNIPTVSEYVSGLKSLQASITELHTKAFVAHYNSPNRSATAKQIAQGAGISGGHAQINLLYGKLGHKLCDALNIKPELRPDDTYRWWSIWSSGWETSDGFIWKMLPQAAEAFEQLGWVEASVFSSTDELIVDEVFIEGGMYRVSVNAYERNPNARRKCIEAHGATCCICGFSFGNSYGKLADGYIHVHHVRPLSEIKGEYSVNPINDLRPVCPNCHAVLHLRNPAYTIDEVKKLLQAQVITQTEPYVK